MTKTILILDDDAEVRTAAVRCLTTTSCRIVATGGAEDPDTLARRHRVDLLVMGSVRGMDTDRSSSLRKAFQTPVVPLFRPSVYSRRRVSPVDLGPNLMLGLSDCRIRIGQHLEARAMPPDVALRWGGFTLKLEPSAFAFEGKGLGLTRVQNAILSLLMLHGGEVVSRGLIEAVVFQGKPKSQTNFISVHISRLRAKLHDNRGHVFIENVKGDGYALFWNPSFSTESIPVPEVVLPSLGGGGRPATAFPAFGTLSSSHPRSRRPTLVTHSPARRTALDSWGEDTPPTFRRS